jgi:2-polyprenyl-6-methoxyphenol hydroxylase-like FAD-dependent oxidoreductase
VNAANIVAGGSVVGHISVAEVDSPYPYALMLPQSDTERLLEEHLSSLGIRVERQVEMTTFTPGANQVSFVLRHADGREESGAAEWLIGCDGAHSTVRHGLGMSFLGNTLQSNWILADVHVKGYPFAETEITTFWHEDGVLVVFPISPGRFRIVANVDIPEGAQSADPTLDEVQQVIERRGPGGITLSDPVWLAAFRINERKVADYRAGRVFLAGDAAHVHSPAGGQGMNTGMQDAFNLAWKLAMTYHKNCSDRLLESYSPERSEVGQQVLSAAGRLTEVALLKNRAAQAVRDFAARVLFGFAPVREAMAENLTELAINYHHSPLNGPKAHGVGAPKPGDRVRPVAGQTPVGAGDRPRFALLAEQSEAVRNLASQFASVLDAEMRPALDAGGMWLVRPDGYVACTAKQDDTRTIAEYLQGLGARR